MEERHCREKLIVATLDLSATRGYDSITVDQIAAAAGVSPNDFTRYFASKDAVIMSLLNDVLHATVAELGRVETDTEPIEALMIATAEMLNAIINGRGVMTRERMLAMGLIVTSNLDLQKQASAARKQLLTAGLAKRMRVDPQNHRVQHAVTMWSAIAAGVYINRRYLPPDYDPQHDEQLPERTLARLAETFDQVMGQAPHKND